ncbi:MAG: hypothetical protein AAFV90_23230 [Cyanobacteria bacterium J06634_5]
MKRSNAKGATIAEAKDAATRLINLLELGSTTIPSFPALVGYMSIVQSKTDTSTINPFPVSPNRGGDAT